MYRLRRFLASLNWTVLACVLALLAAGWALVLSATLPPTQESAWPLPPLAAAQTRWIAVGVLVFLLTALADYHILLRLAPWIYGTALVLLALVLGVGYTSYGARRWFATRWFFIQPGELAKIGTLLFVARLAAAQAGRVSPLRRRIWPPWLWAGLATVAAPMALIAAQPNLGTAMLLAAGATAIWIVAGLPWALVGGTAALTAAAAPVVWTVLKDYQRARILNFLNPYRDPLGGGYTVIQSVIAIGSGGLTGRGYMMGLQNRLDFIPKHHTDFIVSVLGEELGWVGCLGLLLLYLLLYLEGLRIAHRARDFAGMLLAVGIVAILATQTLVNLGMNIGTIPVTGLPLPFLSYGGSSMIVNCGLLGLLLNISRQRRR